MDSGWIGGERTLSDQRFWSLGLGVATSVAPRASSSPGQGTWERGRVRRDGAAGVHVAEGDPEDRQPLAQVREGTLDWAAVAKVL